MPIVREIKRTPETAWFFEQYRIKGPCVKLGMDLWEIEGINVKVGIIEKISARGIYIRRADGTVFRTPKTSILFGEPVPTLSWRPLGTLEEATKWANESVIQETLFHGTHAKNVSSIKSGGFSVARMHGGAFGDGVYLTPSKREASTYGKLLKLKINVKSLYSVTDKASYDRLWRWMMQSHKTATTVAGRTKGFHKLMREKGYDGIAVGGRWHESMFVIFDAKNIMVIR